MGGGDKRGRWYDIRVERDSRKEKGRDIERGNDGREKMEKREI